MERAAMATADPSLHRPAAHHDAAHAVVPLAHFGPYAVRRLALDSDGHTMGREASRLLANRRRGAVE
jgi:hypothetical protein